jgi:hypothetical protein
MEYWYRKNVADRVAFKLHKSKTKIGNGYGFFFAKILACKNTTL